MQIIVYVKRKKVDFFFICDIIIVYTHFALSLKGVLKLMNKINYGLLCDNILKDIEASGNKKKLLLHVCCAPCSSSVIEYLEKYFDITLFFYNPNISDEEEFYYRLSELQRFVEERGGPIYRIITPQYDPHEFFGISSGLENENEGGKRCVECYTQRLRNTALYAEKGGFDYFTTTLSVSPYKNAAKLNEIGLSLENESGAKYLVSDFKKKNGYLRSIELSSVYSLYRQDYCGCVFSQREALKRKASATAE